MSKDLKTLKKYCNVTYKRNNEFIKIGELSDDELDSLFKFLQNKYKLTGHQSYQLKACTYVRNYRSDKNIKKLQLDCHKLKLESNKQKNELNRAYKTADVIINWLKQVTKLDFGDKINK